MGNDTSVPLPEVPPGFTTMCISIQRSDSICVLHHDTATLSTIRQAIQETWNKGIQQEGAICGTGWIFKLSGNPFMPGSSSDSPHQARQMICVILQRLYSIGWKIVSSDLGRFNEKSTMFLQKVPSNFSSVHSLVCIGVNGTDKLQIINLPSQLIEPIKQVVHQFWPKGIQNETRVNNVLDIKLSGHPWLSIMAKVLIQNIIATLQLYQWVYTVGVTIKTRGDSLYFRYDPDLLAGQSSSFCAIILNRTDRLHVISAPEQTVNMIREVIQTVWSHGRIQEEKDHHGSWEFKISGNPWRFKKESVMARYLILKILEAMLQQGWHNLPSLLTFQQREPKHSSLMCLSLKDRGKFLLINMNSHLVEHFKQVLLSYWFKGIQEEKVLSLSFGNVRQLKLKGWPWKKGLNNDAYHIRSFLCFIIEELAKQGWRVLISGNASDVQSLWFIHEPTQQPTAPSYGFNILMQPYGAGMPPAPLYPPLRTDQPARYEIPRGRRFSNPNEPPPSYSQATGWNTP